MRPKNLKKRFVVALHQVRGLLQQSLADYFVSNPVVAAGFVEALGLGKPREAQASPHCPWYSSEANKDDWIFLPRIFQKGEKQSPSDNLLIYPANRDSRGRIDCEIAAAAFGLWVYSYDPAQGTFYYPFTDSNLIFGHYKPPYIMEPNDGYREYLGQVLGDYRLMIGEGSHGVAARGARGCLLQDTFTDVRGAVALEDIILRNFTYMAFPLNSTSNSERFQEAPFAYAALIFPVPMSRDPNSLDRVYRFLEREFVKAAAAILEPVACHLQDVLLLQKQRHIMKGLSDQALAGSFRDACHNFAEQVGRPLSEYRKYGLRDPFAFSGIHIVAPSDIDRDGAASCYNPSIETTSVMLRGCLERCLEPSLLGRESADDSAETRFLEMAENVLQVREANDDSKESHRLIFRKIDRGQKPGRKPGDRGDPVDQGDSGEQCDLGEQIVSFAVLWKIPESASVDEDGSGLGKDADNAIKILLEQVVENLDVCISGVREWIGPANVESGADDFWAPFNEMITSRKVLEMLFHIVGRSLCALVASDPEAGSREAAAQREKYLESVKSLEKLMGTDERLVTKHLRSCFDKLDRASTDDRQVGDVVAAALWVGEDCGISSPLAYGGFAAEEEGTLLTSLASYPVRRVLATLPRHFDNHEKKPNDIKKDEGLVKEIRVTPWSGEDGERLVAPISARFGKDAAGLFNHSLMTTLSDPHRWDSGRAILNSTYVIRRREQFDGSRMIALGRSGQAKHLADKIYRNRTASPDDIVLWLEGKDQPAMCMEWQVGGDALNRGSAAWSVNDECLASLIPSVTDVRIDMQVLSPVRTQLSACLERLREGNLPDRSEEETERGMRFCFPELVFRDNRNITPLVVPSAQSRCHYRDGRGDRWDACTYGELCDCDSADSLARLMRFDLETSSSDTSPGLSLFHPSLGARRHLVWPIYTPENTEPGKLGFFLLSTYVSPLADPVKDEKCPIMLGDAHHELLKTAVDHIGFVLQQERWVDELRTKSKQLVHNTKNDWIRARPKFKEEDGVALFCEDMEARLLADLANFNKSPEKSAWVVDSAGDLEDLLHSCLDSTITELWSTFKTDERYKGSRPVAAIDVTGVDQAGGCFPLYLPRFTTQRTIDELLLNAFKYSAPLGDGDRSIVEVACRYDGESNAGIFSIDFTNVSGGVSSQRQSSETYSSQTGLSALGSMLRINFRESSLFVVPPPEEMREAGTRITISITFDPLEIRNLLSADNIVRKFDIEHNLIRGESRDGENSASG